MLHLCNMKKTEENKKFSILHSTFLGKELHDFVRNKENALAILKENKHRVADLPVSRRALSHWRTLNLFDIYGDNPKQMNISFMALFWLQIVSELRMFGFSLEKIEVVKQQLFANKKYPILEMYVYFSMTRKALDLFMLISPDAEVVFGSKAEIEVSETFGLIEKNYIKLNFHILVNRIIKRKVDIIQQSVQTPLSDKELSVLDLIRDGEYKQITLKFSDGTISKITKKALEKQNPNVLEEIKKIMASNDDPFCKITIERANGKFVSMEKDIMEKT